MTTKPGILVEEGGFGGGSTELQFVGSNPGTSLNLKYYLSKRHTFGENDLGYYGQRLEIKSLLYLLENLKGLIS